MTTPLPRLAPAALVAEAAWQLLWCGVFLFAKSVVLDNLGQTPAASAARRHGVGGAEKAFDAEKAAAVARRSAFTLYFVDMSSALDLGMGPGGARAVGAAGDGPVQHPALCPGAQVRGCPLRRRYQQANFAEDMCRGGSGLRDRLGAEHAAVRSPDLLFVSHESGNAYNARATRCAACYSYNLNNGGGIF
eukprot:CAMPEP_0167795766 /NCGR_PEP_ID=MMETSP0111_2-20121227/14636_1 /TAXON_ID=91324 /ORGANISM="Lotharella globosa, Strain CCCM811" /LENGTH=189 /DNA_ID=CAMNT_0007689507 /DNA_START=331 /DNA_END=901 /DNA_ORIENTATION=+